MARAAAQGFRPIEIVAIFQSFALILSLHHLAADDGIEGEGGAEGVARGLVLADLLGYDVGSSLQGIFGGFHLLAEVFPGFRLGVCPGFGEQDFSERLQPLLASHLCASATFGLEGEIDVFNLRGIPRGFNAGAKFGSEFSLCLYGFDDVFLAVLELHQAGVLIGYGCHLHLVEVARGFLAVTTDEGNGGTIVQECDGAFYLRLLQLQALGYDGVNRHICYIYKRKLLYIHERCVKRAGAAVGTGMPQPQRASPSPQKEKDDCANIRFPNIKKGG